MYTILVKYQSGDSFGTDEREEEIGYSFETREEARIVLGYIREHYEMYQDINGYITPQIKENKLKTYRLRPWFNTDEDSMYYEHTIKYKDRTISCYWCGYFDKLHSAHVILDSPEDDKDNYYA